MQNTIIPTAPVTTAPIGDLSHANEALLANIEIATNVVNDLAGEEVEEAVNKLEAATEAANERFRNAFSRISRIMGGLLNRLEMATAAFSADLGGTRGEQCQPEPTTQTAQPESQPVQIPEVIAQVLGGHDPAPEHGEVMPDVVVPMPQAPVGDAGYIPETVAANMGVEPSDRMTPLPIVPVKPPSEESPSPVAEDTNANEPPQDPPVKGCKPKTKKKAR